MKPMSSFWALCVLALVSQAKAQDPQQPKSNLELSVDASEAARRIFHARVKFAAQPGPLTLQYPKWLPGEHGPTGPITDVAGVRIRAGNQSIPWRRDPLDMFNFLIDVPAGADSVEIDFDFLSPPPAVDGFTSGASASSNLAILSWNQVILYPKGPTSENTTVRAILKLPKDWKLGTALPIDKTDGDTTTFQPASLETMVDSPVLTGRHFRTVQLGPDTEPKHYLHMAAESEAALALKPETKSHLDRLVAETGMLFGARHYKSYHFLVSLSDNIAHFGLEHHESSDNRMDERSLIDDDKLNLSIDLLTHEMVHSWCGKHRRPADLMIADFQQPMQSNLLWVYEGLTSYLGVVLAARSGLWDEQRFRDEIARYAGWDIQRQGRTWRPLEDTGTAAQLLYESRTDWENWRRSVDFYDAGVLLWLDIDATIREQSQGTKSLDDFCKKFFGGAGGQVSVLPYTFDDVVAGLNEVQPYDWKTFLTQRVLNSVASEDLTKENLAGWKVVYKDKRTDLQETRESDLEEMDLTASLGLIVQNEGVIVDITMGGPADKAGIAPGMKVLGINSLRFSEDRLRDALAAKQPIEFLIENSEVFTTHKLDYADGERYAHLEADGKTDWMTKILQSRVIDK